MGGNKFNFFSASKEARQKEDEQERKRREREPHLRAYNPLRMYNRDEMARKKDEVSSTPRITNKKDSFLDKVGEILSPISNHPLAQFPKAMLGNIFNLAEKIPQDPTFSPPPVNLNGEWIGGHYDENGIVQPDIEYGLPPVAGLESIRGFKFFKGKPKPFKHNPRSRFAVSPLGRVQDLKSEIPIRVQKTGWEGSVPEEARLWELTLSEDKRKLPKAAKKAMKYINVDLTKPEPGKTFGFTQRALGKRTRTVFSPREYQEFQSKGFPYGVRVAKGAAPKLNQDVDMDIFQQLYQEWVWNREAANVSGALKAHEFRDLKSLGRQGLLDYQRWLKGPVNERIHDAKRGFFDPVTKKWRKYTKEELKAFEQNNPAGTTALVPYKENQKLTRSFQSLPPELVKRFEAVKNYYGKKYAYLTIDNDLTFSAKQAYLPQIWKESRAEVEKALGGKLTRTPGFTLRSLIENYEEGIKRGLTPVYDNLSDLVGFYERAAEKTLADRSFFDELRSRGWLRPSGTDNRGWVDLNKFPKLVRDTKSKEKVATYWQAPDSIGVHINNYLNPPSGLFDFIAKVFTWTKNLSLSSGILNTPINVHGGNIWRRTVSGDPRGMLHGIFEATPDMFKGGKRLAREKMELFKANEDVLKDLVKHGYTVGGIEDHDSLGLVKGIGEGWSNIPKSERNGLNFPKWVLGKGLQLQNRGFEAPLFEGYLPKRKFNFALNRIAELEKAGFDRETILRQVAKEANTQFGGMDWNSKLWSWNRKQGAPIFGKDIQSGLRIGLLAPDWLVSNMNMGKNIITGLNEPFNPLNATAMRNLTRGLAMRGATAGLTAYLGKDVLTKNPSFNRIPMPWDDKPGMTEYGRERSLPTFGTANEFLRLPEQLFVNPKSAAFDFIRNRVSIPGKSVVHLIANTDDFGNPLHGKTKYGKEIPWYRGYANVAKEFGAPLLPPYVASAYDFGFGRTGLEEALVSGFELPFQYRFPDRKQKKPSGNNPFNFGNSNPFSMGDNPFGF